MSINLLKGFEFRRKKTFLHALDPRTKLVITGIYTVLAIAYSNILPLAFFLLTLLPLLAAGKILGRWLTSVKGLSFIITFIIIFNTLLNSLDFALSMCLRILLLVSAFTLFFMTVHPDDLAASLLAMKVPFSFTFTLSLATRFMPTLAAEAQNIIDAQRSRGLELEKGNLMTRVKNMVPILIPLIINSIKRAFSIAEALESKGFGSSRQRTNMFSVKMTRKDYLVILLAMVLVVTFITLHVTGSLPPFFHATVNDLLPNL